ncbi:MAG: glycosyltransferase family 4 protein [bacterium]|nr:glycosyltransferase family 4 protein [bacterium]
MQLFRNWKSKTFIAKSLANNIISPRDLSYVVEAKSWAIRYVGSQVIKNINTSTDIKATITSTNFALRNSLVHFGSLHTIFRGKQPKKLTLNNKYVLSIFHLLPQKSNPFFLVRISNQVFYIHTSCENTKKKIIDKGIPENKVKVIPLGVDLQTFKPADSGKKSSIRQKLNIPKNSFVIGSFQKDGIGWQDGLQPKLEKGPDIFIKTVKEVNKSHPLHVLLIGPARGYVKTNLKKAGVPFTHLGYLPDINEVAPYYSALDAYLITSREEGGPLALLEAWASKIPVISTEVGMVPDIANDKKTALLANSEDVKTLSQKISTLISSKELNKQLTEQAYTQAKKFDWPLIAQRYYNELYKPLLKQHT